MSAGTDVTVIGAGPYGLSLAAHLRQRGVEHRIIGRPMETWRSKMPHGMLLKSAGFASNLSDPDGAFTLGAFCRQAGLAYGDIDVPVPLDTFCRYGLAFQQRFVPHLEDDTVTAITRDGAGFHVLTGQGAAFRTRRVVLAIGIDHFRFVPETLSHLGREHLSHAADHQSLEPFRGRRLAVIGAGASAINLAVLAHEAGAAVHLIARRPALGFDNPWGAGKRRLRTRLRWPLSGLGPGWSKKLAELVPSAYRYLPDRHRLGIAQDFLGPSGGWPMKERAADVPQLLGYAVRHAMASASGVELDLRASDGSLRRIGVDHVIAGTGYSADIRHLGFLDGSLIEQVDLIGRAPRLSAHFESSVPGLYFVGPVASTSFGPLMRFAHGTDYASRRLSRHLAGVARSRPAPQASREGARLYAAREAAALDQASGKL